MANQFVSMPTPAANGPGTSVDVSSFGAAKTFTVADAGGALITIEMSNQATPTKWSPVVGLLESGTQTVNCAARWMRAVVGNYQGNGAPTVNLGGDDTGALFATVVAPSGNGNGTAVDTTTLPPFKTVQVTGPFTGALNIEISEDNGVTYSGALSFHEPGQQSALFTSQFVRVSRNGVEVGAAGSPLINIAATEIPGSPLGPDDLPTSPLLVGEFFDTFVSIASVGLLNTTTGNLGWEDNVDAYPERDVLGLVSIAIGSQVSGSATDANLVCRQDYAGGGDGTNVYTAVLGHGRFTLEWRAALNTALPAQGSGIRFSMSLGMGTGDLSPGLFFYCNPRDLGNDHWWALTDNVFNIPSWGRDTGVAVDVNVLHVFKVVYDSTLAVPSAIFYIDGVVVATITTHLPLNANCFAPQARLFSTDLFNAVARFDYVYTKYEYA